MVMKCIICGEDLGEYPGYGAPKKYCEECFREHRKKYKRIRHLKRKLSNLENKLKKILPR